MKKIKFMLVALLALFGFNNAMADIFVGDELSDNDYYYVVQTIKPSAGTGTVYIKKINSAKTGEITLPTQFVKTDGGKTYTFTVTGIADAIDPDAADPVLDKNLAAFKDQTSLTKVTVPSTYEYIGSYAFYGCTNLAAIDFSGATGLKTIADKALVTIQVTAYDFSACTKLTGFTGTPFVDPSVSDNNLFIASMTLPTSNAFKTIGTALAHLPNLETLNISESKVQEIVANAFENDQKLTSMTLPGSVKKIYGAAFEGSAVATLTIDATSIQEIGAATPAETDGGDDITAVYGADAGELLESLTITNELKGIIKSGAFAGEDEMTTLALNCTFGTTGQIEGEAFADIDKIEKVTLGDITDHQGGDFTIMPNAFYGETLTEVEIGKISTANAIAGGAFNADGAEVGTLTKVTIASVKADNTAIAGGAFLFDDAASQVTIGEVRSNSALNPVFAAGAFTFKAVATVDDPKACTIAIGAVSAQGKNFSEGTFVNTTETTLTFNGDIEESAIDAKILADNSLLETLTFNGKVGENGIGGTAGVAVFGGMPDAAVVNFNGALAENAVAENAFALTASGNSYEQEEVDKIVNTSNWEESDWDAVLAEDEVNETTPAGTYVNVGEGVVKVLAGWNADDNKPIYQTEMVDKIYTAAAKSDAIAQSEGALTGDDFEQVGDDAFKLIKTASTNSSLIVNYDLTNVAAADVDETVNPFNQKAFVDAQLASDAERTVTLSIIPSEGENASAIAVAIFNLIAEGQISIDNPEVGQDPVNDIIYAVQLLQEPENDPLTLLVWEKTGTNTSYGRWYITAEKYPNGLKIARRGNEGMKTLSLYTTYVEDDADHTTLNINMQPIVSIDGYYYLPLSAYFSAGTPDEFYANVEEYNADREEADRITAEQFEELTDAEKIKTPGEPGYDGLVILAKATKTNSPVDPIEVEYEEYDGEEASVFYTDYRVIVSDHVVTNEQLRGHSDNHANPIDVADTDDLYFITNPEYHEGISAPCYDFRTAFNVYVDEGSFIVTGTHYAAAQAARMIWHDGEEEATAIMAAKKVVTTGSSNVIYNLAGQKVNASYKGIVIKDGKKMIQK